MRIGVFDSGVGGLSVAWTVQKAFPNIVVDYVNDTKNVPYSDKTPQEMMRCALPMLRPMAAQCDLIIVACNTLTTNCIDELHEALPDAILLGIEPMVGAAACLTKNRIITVCATPATLSSKRYQALKHQCAADITVLEPDCGQWSRLIQTNQLQREDIERMVEDVCSQGADVIVLGCTFYHWIEQAVLEVADGRAYVLQPEATIVKRLWSLLKTLGHPV